MLSGALATLTSKLLSSALMRISSTPAAAAAAVAVKLQATVAATGAHTPHPLSRHLSSKAAPSQAAQQQAMVAYWRSLLRGAKSFGAQRPAALLLGGAAVSAGVWVAQVSLLRPAFGQASLDGYAAELRLLSFFVCRPLLLRGL